MSLSILDRIRRHWLYWVAIAVCGLAMEGVALFYQYGLNYGPCILCVQARAWVMGIVLVALIGAFARRSRVINGSAHALMLAFAGGLLATSWETLAIERGWTEASCEMESGFPAWLPLHEWLPSTFEAWELCGYTPPMPLGVTMAEALITVAALAVAFFAVQLVGLLRGSRP